MLVRGTDLLDPVTFQVIMSRLAGIVDEMQESIFRTGYSTIIRESRDASCLLTDIDGGVIGERVIHALHIGCVPEFVRAVRREFGESIAPGDAFITNHPYIGGTPHTLDVALVMPIFHEGELVAFAGNTAHKSDLGGVVPGTGYGQAREIFQEGTIYPPVRIMAGGEIVRDVERILRANSRTPDLIVGDIRGQAGVASLGARRVGEMIARYGVPTMRAAFEATHEIAAARIRAELRTWPDGVFEGESWVDNDGIALDTPIRYHVRVTKSGERIHFDFSGANDQVQGPVNIGPPMVRPCIYFAMIGMMDPTISNNAGIARVVETTFRKGSVLDPYFPAPGNTYMSSALAITEAILQALSGFVPERAQAGNGGLGGNSIAGERADGSRFVQFEPIGSAYGGHAGGDGESGIDLLLSNCSAASIEILESEYPTRLERFELIRDSGGPGEYRGGLAPRRVYRILTKRAQWSLRGGRHNVPAFGVQGGRPGRAGSCTLNPGTAEERALPSRFSGVLLTTDDLCVLEKAGGGGFGDPRRRRFEAIVEDVLDGYVSRRAAIEEYGADPTRLDAALAR